ncbi:MAG: ATP-binding cassette domain-containing protein, partial [Chloroflexi bacterium]|nr:ATP-binding cassette domain-containing protein [Chloroflexota bacterium]
MDSPALWTDHDRLALRSTGALAGMTAELALLQSRLASASDWRPAKPLLAEIAWVQQQFEQMTASWSSKLVVALVGPSGAGKSTLLNALA